MQRHMSGLLREEKPPWGESPGGATSQDSRSSSHLVGEVTEAPEETTLWAPARWVTLESHSLSAAWFPHPQVTTYALQLLILRSCGLGRAASTHAASLVARVGAGALAAFSCCHENFHTPARGWQPPGLQRLINEWKITHGLEKDPTFPAPDQSSLPRTRLQA